MQLLTKSQFAKHCGKDPSAISHALRKGKLETFQETGKINPNSPLSQKFKATVGKGQKDLITGITGINGEIEPGSSKDLTKAAVGVVLAQEQKIIEEAELKKEQRIDKQLKNAYTRGELVSIEAINQTIMTWFDRWLSSNKRGWNGSFDEFMRGAFKIFENEVKANDPDFTPHEITRPEHKQKWINRFESWADDGKKTSVEKLKEIQIEQGKK